MVMTTKNHTKSHHSSIAMETAHQTLHTTGWSFNCYWSSLLIFNFKLRNQKKKKLARECVTVTLNLVQVVSIQSTQAKVKVIVLVSIFFKTYNICWKRKVYRVFRIIHNFSRRYALLIICFNVCFFICDISYLWFTLRIKYKIN